MNIIENLKKVNIFINKESKVSKPYYNKVINYINAVNDSYICDITLYRRFDEALERIKDTDKKIICIKTSLFYNLENDDFIKLINYINSSDKKLILKEQSFIDNKKVIYMFTKYCDDTEVYDVIRTDGTDFKVAIVPYSFETIQTVDMINLTRKTNILKILN